MSPRNAHVSHLLAPALLRVTTSPVLLLDRLPPHLLLLHLALADARLHLHQQTRVHLFLSKKEEGVKNMEPPPRLPKQRTDLAAYNNAFRLRVGLLPGLKRRAEVVPAFTADNQVTSYGIDDDVPETLEPLGAYPQEIVVANPTQGALINSQLFVHKWPCKLQCKAVEPSVVYTLDLEVLNQFTKRHSTFRNEVGEVKTRLDTAEGAFGINYFDYSVYGWEAGLAERAVRVREATMKWKFYAVNFILHAREEKRKNGAAFLTMVSKLKAIVRCQEAENEELEQQVVSGEVPPECVTEDGQLDEAKLAELQATGDLILPDTHPVVKAFKTSCEIVKGETGQYKMAFEKVSSSLKEHQAKAEELTHYIDQLRQVFSLPAAHSVKSALSRPTVRSAQEQPVPSAVPPTIDEESKRSRNLLDRIKK